MIDFGSFGGILLALLGIAAGMRMEGGRLAQIMQPAALLIVLGGTGGAVMLQFPLNIFWAAMKQMVGVFVTDGTDPEAVIEHITEFSQKARKQGMMSLEAEVDAMPAGFLRQALTLAIDGTEPDEVRTIMTLELDNHVEFAELIPHVLEAAGGFAPTVGILGAVLGLIQVMQHLEDMAAVGRGIAVAFVATIYGVGLANLICLPAAGKMKIRQREEQVAKTIMLEGVIAILEGINPRMIDAKLRTYLFDGHPPEERKAPRKRRTRARGGRSSGRQVRPEEIEAPA
jgi:chemotaxis protein MotA